MKVYCLFKEYDAIDKLIGIFDTLEKANIAASELVKQTGSEYTLITNDYGTVFYETNYDDFFYTTIWEVE